MNVKQAKNHEFGYGLVTESHIMMNLWAGDASAPRYERVARRI